HVGSGSACVQDVHRGYALPENDSGCAPTARLSAESSGIYSRSTPPSNFEIGSSHAVRPSNRHADRKRPILGPLARFGRTIQRFARGAENATDKLAGSAGCDRYHHGQEPHTQSVGRAIHPVRTENRGRDHRADEAEKTLGNI